MSKSYGVTAGGAIREIGREYAVLAVTALRGETIRAQNSLGKPVQGLRIFGRTMQDGAPSPENPVELVSAGSGGTIAATVCGKNLLENRGESRTASGLSYEVHDDGSVSITGSASAAVYYLLNGGYSGTKAPVPAYLIPGERYTISDARITFYSESGTVGNYENQSFTMPENALYYGAFIRIPATDGIDKTYYPMIRHADVEDDSYEAYAGRSVALSTPGGLPGIPVGSDLAHIANYTDESGQAWVCDEIDFGRGMYIKRVDTVMGEKFTHNGTRWQCTVSNPRSDALDSKLYYPVMCNIACFKGDTAGTSGTCRSGNQSNAGYMMIYADADEDMSGVELMYLCEPEEIMLYEIFTEDELEQYAAMSMHSPATTIYNDGGAGMEIEYITDGAAEEILRRVTVKITKGYGVDAQGKTRLIYSHSTDLSSAVVTLSEALTFNGEEQEQGIRVMLGDVELVRDLDYSVSGNKATAAGSYSMTITGIGDYEGTIRAAWSIAVRRIELPAVTDAAFTYSGDPFSPTCSYDEAWVTQDGEAEATAAGSHYITFALIDKKNTCWADDSTADLSYKWTIAVRQIAKPTVSNTAFTYSGETFGPTYSYDTAWIDRAGTATAKNAGNYSIDFSLRDSANTCWAGGGTAALSYPWKIATLEIAKPTVSNTSFTYSGETFGPTYSYDTAWINLSGDIRKTNAGNYSIDFSLKDAANTCWAGGGTAALSYPWKIAQASGKISVTPTSLKVRGAKGSSATAEIDYTGDGAISAVCSDPGVVDVSISGNVLTVTAYATINSTITITLSKGTNYTGASCRLEAICDTSIFESYSGAYDVLGTYSIDGESHQLYRMRESGTLVIYGDVKAWLCGGGVGGGNGSPGDGGAGGYASTGSLPGGSHVVEIGTGGAADAVGGTTTITCENGDSISAASGTLGPGKGGGSGGGGAMSNVGRAGTGVGVNEDLFYPFGIETLYAHCAGGGAGAYDPHSGNYKYPGGDGGSLGSNGHAAMRMNAGSSNTIYAGAGGEHGGGAGALHGDGGNASYYGAGGGGAGWVTYTAVSTYGGAGFQGVVYIAVPV